MHAQQREQVKPTRQLRTLDWRLQLSLSLSLIRPVLWTTAEWRWSLLLAWRASSGDVRGSLPAMTWCDRGGWLCDGNECGWAARTQRESLSVSQRADSAELRAWSEPPLQRCPIEMQCSAVQSQCSASSVAIVTRLMCAVQWCARVVWVWRARPFRPSEPRARPLSDPINRATGSARRNHQTPPPTIHTLHTQSQLYTQQHSSSPSGRQTHPPPVQVVQLVSTL